MAEETATATATGEALDLKRFLSSMRLNPDIAEPVPMVTDNLQTISEDIRDEDRFLSGMAKGRVAQVVGQRDGFHQIFVELQGPGDRAAQLGDFERMGQPGSKQVTFMVQEDLRLVDQAPESGGMHDAVAVALVLGSGRRRLLGMKPAARPRGIAGMTSQDHLRRAGSSARSLHSRVPRERHAAPPCPACRSPRT